MSVYMNRQEFLRGWLLLTSQPWGRTYRSESSELGPSPAKIQAELYYKALSATYPPAWHEVCEMLAGGDHWPSLSICKEALRHAKAHPPQAPQLTADPLAGYCTKAEFGLALYNTAKAVADLRYAKETEKAQLRDELSGYMKGLSPDETTQILQRYPDMVTL